jgi:RNA polymerase sigma factor (sigma-70 family)
MAMDEQELSAVRYVVAPAEELERNLERNDEDVFAEELLAAMRPAYRALRSMGLSEDEVADVLQDASIRAWRHRAQRRGTFAPWFIAIAYRETRRPHRRWLVVPAFWQGSRASLDLEDRSDDLDFALARLPRRQRAAVSLRYGSDLTILDVAGALGISEPAAKQLLARARDSLRRTLSSIREVRHER